MPSRAGRRHRCCNTWTSNLLPRLYAAVGLSRRSLMADAQEELTPGLPKQIASNKVVSSDRKTFSSSEHARMQGIKGAPGHPP